MGSFADEFVEERYRLTPDEAAAWTPELWCELKVANLIDRYKAVSYAATIPRRVGQVTPQELGLDKRRMRKLAYAHKNLAIQWGQMCDAVTVDLTGPVPADLRKLGAQMEVERTLADWIDAATLHRSIFSTRALQIGARSLANKGARYYTQEIKDLERVRALRPHSDGPQDVAE